MSESQMSAANIASLLGKRATLPKVTKESYEATRKKHFGENKIGSYWTKNATGESIYVIGYGGPGAAEVVYTDGQGNKVQLGKTLLFNKFKSSPAYFGYYIKDASTWQEARDYFNLPESEGNDVETLYHARPVVAPKTAPLKPRAKPTLIEAKKLMHPAEYRAAMTGDNIKEYLKTQSNLGLSYGIGGPALKKLREAHSPPAIEAVLAVADSYNTKVVKKGNGEVGYSVKRVARTDAQGNTSYVASVKTITIPMVEAAISSTEACAKWDEVKVPSKEHRKPTFDGGVTKNGEETFDLPKRKFNAVQPQPKKPRVKVQ